MARAWPHTPEVQSASSIPPGVLESGSGELSTGGRVATAHTQACGPLGWWGSKAAAASTQRQRVAACPSSVTSRWPASVIAWAEECGGVPRSP